MSTPPSLKPGAELYDSIMSAIEPDLVSTAIPHLRTKYRGESPADRRTRADRYLSALEEYERRFRMIQREALDFRPEASRPFGIPAAPRPGRKLLIVSTALAGLGAIGAALFLR
jgi:hypothetical protein